MEEWIGLFNIFLNSPTPESEASLWLHQSFNASSTPTITPTSFLSLLTQPTDAIFARSSSPSSSPHRVMWMETLPNLVQARILSFLAYDCRCFSSLELSKLATGLLEGGEDVDFWVRKGAHQLLDKLSERSNELNCVGKSMDSEFYSLPTCLEGAGSGDCDGFDPVLPWLPLSLNELKLEMVADSCADSEESFMEADEDEGFEDVNVKNLDGSQEGNVYFNVMNDSLEPDLRRIAADLNSRVVDFEGDLDIVRLADEIRQLCFGRRKVESLSLFELIEPWQADDEIMASLLSSLLHGKGEEVDELGWPSQVLCSTLLPKLLILKEPASRVIMTTAIEYCRLHQRAAEYALLFPLILREEGLNSSICDVVTRIMKECLNSAHVSAFCQKLLSSAADVRKCICLSCHQPMISSTLLWTEATFSLFQNILNNNVHLTKDSVDHLVYKVHELAERFARSLKFGNFLLCFVGKCFPLLKPHKHLLTGAAASTNTIVTKSLLMKLDSL